MRFERIVGGSFGGAYMGIIATHVPSIFGFAYKPSQNVQLVAAIIGMVIAAAICVREHRRTSAPTGNAGECSIKSN